jgi:hypothetical protein
METLQLNDEKQSFVMFNSVFSHASSYITLFFYHKTGVVVFKAILTNMLLAFSTICICLCILIFSVRFLIATHHTSLSLLWSCLKVFCFQPGLILSWSSSFGRKCCRGWICSFVQKFLYKLKHKGFPLNFMGHVLLCKIRIICLVYQRVIQSSSSLKNNLFHHFFYFWVNP